MKTQQIVELRKLLDHVREARQHYMEDAESAYMYQKLGGKQPGEHHRLLDVASASGGTLMNVYNSLFVWLDTHHDEVLQSLQQGKGKR